MTEALLELACRTCGDTFTAPELRRCPGCGERGRLSWRLTEAGLERADVRGYLSRDAWLWRFAGRFPLAESAVPPPLQVGDTPLFGSLRLAEWVGLPGLMVKDEGQGPTGLPLDRAAAMLVAEAHGLPGLQAQLPELLLPLAAQCAAAALPLRVPSLDAHPQAEALRARGVLEEESASTKGQGEAAMDGPAAHAGLMTLGLELGERLAERPPEWVAVDARVPRLAEAVADGLAEFARLTRSRRPRLLAVEEEGQPSDPLGSDARIALRASKVGEAAEVATRATGLTFLAEGAWALAGLREALREGEVGSEGSAVVVLHRPVAPVGSGRSRRRK